MAETEERAEVEPQAYFAKLERRLAEPGVFVYTTDLKFMRDIAKAWQQERLALLSEVRALREQLTTLHELLREKFDISERIEELAYDGRRGGETLNELMERRNAVLAKLRAALSTSSTAKDQKS